MLLIYFVVTVPDVINILFRNTRTKILYGNADHLFLPLLGNDNMLCFTAIIDRIDHKVVEYLGKTDSVRKNLCWIIQMNLKLKSVLNTIDLIFLHLFTDEGIDFKVLFLQLNSVFLQTGKIQKIVDKIIKSLCLIHNYLQILIGLFFRQINHHFPIAGNHRQRCTQIMGYIGNQITLCLICLMNVLRCSCQGGIQFHCLCICIVTVSWMIDTGIQKLGIGCNGDQRIDNLPVKKNRQCKNSCDQKDHNKIQLVGKRTDCRIQWCNRSCNHDNGIGFGSIHDLCIDHGTERTPFFTRRQGNRHHIQFCKMGVVRTLQCLVDVP